MNVKILKIETNELADAYIEESGRICLPSLQEGWRFNFLKHSKEKRVETYVLITKETPNIIEGCLVFKMKKDMEPYMAYIEIAPHNRGEKKKYDMVAGCLIAYASRLSFILGKGDYKGWLAFDVQEEKEKDQRKLMTMYSKKYGARKINETTMLIIPGGGEKLIETYLKR